MFSSTVQPKIPAFFAVDEKQTCYYLHGAFIATVWLLVWIRFLTFFGDRIYRFHASFNVIDDVTMEQPSTRILRTHLYGLKVREVRTSHDSLVQSFTFSIRRQHCRAGGEGVGILSCFHEQQRNCNRKIKSLFLQILSIYLVLKMAGLAKEHFTHFLACAASHNFYGTCQFCLLIHLLKSDEKLMESWSVLETHCLLFISVFLSSFPLFFSDLLWEKLVMI